MPRDGGGDSQHPSSPVYRARQPFPQIWTHSFLPTEMEILTGLFISFLSLCSWLEGPKLQKLCSFSHECLPGDLSPPQLGFRLELASQEDPEAGDLSSVPSCLVASGRPCPLQRQGM